MHLCIGLILGAMRRVASAPPVTENVTNGAVDVTNGAVVVTNTA